MAPATGNLRFCTGLLFLSRASVDSDANGHTTVVSLLGGTELRSAGFITVYQWHSILVSSSDIKSPTAGAHMQRASIPRSRGHATL